MLGISRTGPCLYQSWLATWQGSPGGCPSLSHSSHMGLSAALQVQNTVNERLLTGRPGGCTSLGPSTHMGLSAPLQVHNKANERILMEGQLGVPHSASALTWGYQLTCHQCLYTASQEGPVLTTMQRQITAPFLIS
jgi:hypothetical protein